MRQRLEQFFHVGKTIRQDENHPPLLQTRHNIMKDLGEIRLTARLGVQHFLIEHAQVTITGARRNVRANIGIKRHETNAVALPHNDVR